MHPIQLRTLLAQGLGQIHHHGSTIFAVLALVALVAVQAHPPPPKRVSPARTTTQEGESQNVFARATSFEKTIDRSIGNIFLAVAVQNP